jgi:hypothetical protein
MSRTVVVSPTRRQALAWCRANGVQPYAWATRLVTTPGAVHGLTFTADDRVVFTHGITAAMADALWPCYLIGGRDVDELREVVL